VDIQPVSNRTDLSGSQWLRDFRRNEETEVQTNR
jgi:hypothetical protein